MAKINLIRPPKVNVNALKGSFWKQIGMIVIGTTISLVFTITAATLMDKHQRAKDRRLSAMMVMGDIEKFARRLDIIAKDMYSIDTLATYLLAIPQDTLETTSNDYWPYVSMTGALSFLARDKSTEKIFTNSIETWKNMGNFLFIENVGHCFSLIDDIEIVYKELYDQYDNINKRIRNSPDSYPGKSMGTKFLLDTEFRNYLDILHRRADYLHYAAELLRYGNSKNMMLIGISEKDVMKFVEVIDKDVESDHQLPIQQDYFTPKLNSDSLPDFQTWFEVFEQNF